MRQRGITIISILFTLLGWSSCKQDNIPLSQQEQQIRLLQKEIWVNTISIDEQFTDNNLATSYQKRATLSFTPTQFTYKIELFNPSDSLKSTQPNEYWGDFSYSSKDSILVLKHTVAKMPKDESQFYSQAERVTTRFKVLEISAKSLILQPLSESNSNTSYPEITYRPE